MNYKKYNNFETFTAADANILMRQGLIVVGSESERDAIDSPTAGMRVYRSDTGKTEAFDGSGWLVLVEPGLGSIVPSSVSGTGVSVDAAGRVSFTSATEITLDGVFSAAYRNYRILIDSTGTAAGLSCVLRTGGGTDVTSLYDRTELLARNGTATSSTALNASSWSILGFVSVLIQADIEVSGPFQALATTAISRAGGHTNPAAQSTSNGVVTNYFTHRTAASYAGMKFTYTNAQSGSIRVYGYN